MSTFDKIINNVIKFDNTIFYLNSNKIDNIDNMCKFFFYNLYCNNESKKYKNKFHFLDETSKNFYFLEKSIERKEFINLFYKIQRIYYTLNRFVYFYKYKKSKIAVNTDLQLNEIKLNDSNVICIYHIGSRYLFKIEELLSIIYTSLTNCSSFFAEPLCIKNPYNNIPFGKSILYYIYFYLNFNAKIRFIKHEHLDLFFKFKQCNFDMTKFVNNYEYILREYAIKNHVNNLSKKNMMIQIQMLIHSFNLTKPLSKQIYVSNEFPEDELIRIMKPYVYLIFIWKYSLVKKNADEAFSRLYNKLREFQKFNPQFGRKVFKSKTVCVGFKLKKIRTVEFNMKHKKFNSYDINDFMNNHLNFKYDGYGYQENTNEHEDTDEDTNEHEDINQNQNTNQNTNEYEDTNEHQNTNQNTNEHEDTNENQDADIINYMGTNSTISSFRNASFALINNNTMDQEEEDEDEDEDEDEEEDEDEDEEEDEEEDYDSIS